MRRSRGESHELLGDNLAGEDAPFCFPTNSGVNMLPAPLDYIPDLLGKITQMVDQNDK